LETLIMTTIFHSLTNAAPSGAKSPLAASLITGLALVLGSLGPTYAAGGSDQSPTPQRSANDMRRCQQLYDAWTHYVDTAANTRSATWGVALEECRKGNTAAGIATLTRAFESAKMPLPAVESAGAR
jgi:hypothetical protein